MLAKPLEVKRSILEKRLAALTEEYVCVNAELDNNLNTSNRLRLQRQADELYQQMEQVDIELKELDTTNKNPNFNYLELQEKLPKIDFKEAISIVDSIVGQFGREGGAALFLLQNSYPMAGKLCVSEIRERLINSTSDFKHYPIEFSPQGQLDEFELLQRLASYIDVEFISDEKQYAQGIIQKICKSLQGGSVVFFELKKWDELSSQKQILTWFIDNFWTPLIHQLPTVAEKYRKVKFIVVIMSDTELPAECLTLSCYCTQDNFDPKEILNLPLQNWTQADIVDWLDSYSGLPGDRIDLMATKLYKVKSLKLEKQSRQSINRL